MSLAPLTDLAGRFHAGAPIGIASICSAHPLVLRAAVQHARDTGGTILIEATCNQVNHEGGYTGMTPRAFADHVAALMSEEGCPADRVILGGDHLGPNPWRAEPADVAVGQAAAMIRAYVEAGFRKIHIDASMGCAGEPTALDDTTTAKRAVGLVAAAEDAATQAQRPSPVYVIGTEVPPPGGADHVLDSVQPTSPSDALKTVKVHRDAFEDAGLADAFSRVIALVVQPGVEFGNENVVRYSPEVARGLTAALPDMPGFVYEAHSTDYQGEFALAQLVRDGFTILKVGPELTFALREALYALDLIASDLVPGYGARPLATTMEDLMMADPDHWSRHYGSGAGHAMRHYSLSDRIRYYWNDPAAEAAVARLFDALTGVRVPLPLMWQHLPGAADQADLALDPQYLVLRRIRQVLQTYHLATTQETAP